MYTDRLAAGDAGWWRASTRRTADMLEDVFWWVDDTVPTSGAGPGSGAEPASDAGPSSDIGSASDTSASSDTGPASGVGSASTAWLLIDTTAVLVHGLARSHGAHPAEVTGADLVTWASPRIAGMLQLAEDFFLRPPVDPDGMWAWHRAFGREWRTTVQQVAYLLVAAGHDLLPAGSGHGLHPSAAGHGLLPAGAGHDLHPSAAGHGLLPPGDPVAALWRDLTEGDDPGRRYPAVAGPAIVHGLAEMVRHFGFPAHR